VREHANYTTTDRIPVRSSEPGELMVNVPLGAMLSSTRHCAGGRRQVLQRKEGGSTMVLAVLLLFPLGAVRMIGRYTIATARLV
jgi:hypothetical protein